VEVEMQEVQQQQDEDPKKSKEFAFPIMNRVAIAGRLTQDPPIRWTSRGVPVTNFIIATQPEKEAGMGEGMERENCFVSVVVWAQQAIQCNKYLRKGNAVLIIGELQSMPNHAPEREFYPVQINAQWIQYLEKGIVSVNETNEIVYQPGF
jgi:single-strand DNA-binding protein